MSDSKATTLESRVKTRNGVRRMSFVCLSMLIEVILICLLFTSLASYAEWINLAMRIAAIILVLAIYGLHRTSSMKTPWIILILSFPVMGSTLYLLVGLNGHTWRMRQRYEEIDAQLLPLLPDNAKELTALHAAHPSKAGISEYLLQHAGYPVWQNTTIRYYDTALKGLKAQLVDLAQAQSYIFMEYHAIENERAWHEVEEVLAERAAAGVEVRVFYDDMGSIGFITTDFIRHLASRGIRCRVFNPFVPGLNAFLNNRDHRKLTVIDGRIGYVGGYNLADEYFGYTHPYGEWKDTGIRIEGDAVRSVTVTFLEMWNAVKDKDQNDEDPGQYLLPEIPYTAPTGSGWVQPYADTPLDDEQVGEEVYISIINKADRYVWFITPYLIITDEMMHAFSLAAKRGVDVRIITPGIPDKDMVYGVTRSFYNGLVRNGVRIYEWTPGFCHAKMCVSDDVIATCGSINLDYRSLYHHFENGCVMVDAPAVLEIRDDLARTFTESREVTEEYRSGRSQPMRLWHMFLRLFAQLM